MTTITSSARPARSAALLVCSMLSTLPCAAAATSHGGAYRGPNLPPPALGTPGAGGANTGGPSTSGGGYKNSDPAAWSQWWALSRDMYMQRSERVFEADVTGDPVSGPNSGSGSTPDNDTDQEGDELAPGQRVSDETLFDLVVPGILMGLEKKASVDLLTASLMALAKIGQPADKAASTDLAKVISRYLDHDETEVAEAAVIALGVLGDQNVATLLTEIEHGSRAGGKLVGERKVPTRTRAYAAYALAVIGSHSTRDPVRAFVVHHLVAELQVRRPDSRDLSVACVLGLGLVALDEAGLPDAEMLKEGVVPPPAGSREGQCIFLLSMLDDRRHDNVVKSYVPVALARLTQGAAPELKTLVGEVLVELIRHQATVDVELRAGAIQAMGLLGDDDMDPLDELMRERLHTVSKKGSRLQRNLALVALGRIGGRAGGGARADVAREIRDELMKRVARGKSAEKPWAALAVGLLENGRMRQGETPDPQTLTALRHAFRSVGNPSFSGALAISLGLCRDTESVPELLKRLKKGDETVRGHSATALGLIGAPEAIDALRELSWSGPPGIARESAIALALCRDSEAWRHLGPAGKRSSRWPGGVATLLALAYVGDSRAVAPLLEALINDRSSDVVRAYAIVALGIICDKDIVPWNQPLAQDACWWSAPPTLLDSRKGLGVVDLF